MSKKNYHVLIRILCQTKLPLSPHTEKEKTTCITFFFLTYSFCSPPLSLAMEMYLRGHNCTRQLGRGRGRKRICESKHGVVVAARPRVVPKWWWRCMPLLRCFGRCWTRQAGTSSTNSSGRPPSTSPAKVVSSRSPRCSGTGSSRRSRSRSKFCRDAATPRPS